jgi:hypothetical protein
LQQLHNNNKTHARTTSRRHHCHRLPQSKANAADNKPTTAENEDSAPWEQKISQ